MISPIRSRTTHDDDQRHRTSARRSAASEADPRCETMLLHAAILFAIQEPRNLPLR